MNYIPWETGGGSKNILYTKHDYLPPFLGRLWWDETISTKVSRAIRHVWRDVHRPLHGCSCIRCGSCYCK
ncbi:hypothetical protein MKW92_053885 [Papaver armeniacum]|nr:hypothetical protein MKW92_053885 [Papaver armeniacum]